MKIKIPQWVRDFFSTQSSTQKFYVTKRGKLLVAFAIAVHTLVLIAGALGLRHLHASYSMKQFLPAKHPILTQDTAVKKRFSQEDNFNFIITVTLPAKSAGTWFDSNRLGQVKNTTEALAELKGISGVTSLTNIDGAANTKEGLIVGKLVELTKPKDLSSRVLQDPLLTPQLISKDGRTLVFVAGVKPISSEETYVLKGIAKSKVKKMFPRHEVRVGGVPAIQSELSFLLKQELARFILLALLLNAAILVLTFKNWSGLVIPLILIAFANIVSVGLQAWMGYSFTVLLTTLPVIVSLTVLSMVTHSFLRLNEEIENENNRAEDKTAALDKIRLVLITMRRLLMPNLLVPLTALVGFIMSAFTDVPLLHEYGIVIAVSMAVCWYAVNLVMPVLLIVFPVTNAREWTQKPARWFMPVFYYPKTIVTTVIVASVAFSFGAFYLNWAPRLFDDLPSRYEARSTTEYIDKELGGTIPLMVSISLTNNAWSSPKALGSLDTLMKKWRKKPEVGGVIGLPDFLKVIGTGEHKTLPKDRKAVAETLFLYSLSPQNPTRNFITGNGKSILVILRMRDVPADKMQEAISDIRAQTLQTFPKAKVQMAGMASNAHPLSLELSHMLIFGFWPSVFATAAILLIIFRSFFWMFMALIPNLVPTALLIGVLAMVQTPVKPSLAVVFSVALGLAFNNTVFLLERLIHMQKSDRIPFRRTFYLEAFPCVISTLIVMSGFMIFLASYFDVNKQFGAYVLLSLVFGLVGDLLLLPCMLQIYDQRLAKKKAKNALALAALPQPIVIEEDESSAKPAIAAGLALFLFISFSAPRSEAKAASPTAQELLTKIEKQITSKNESAVMTMQIIEADGSKKERKIEIKRLNGDKAYARVRLLSPADLKGTALLSVYEGSSEDQWLYLPSSKQTRRIISSGKQSSFLGSELSFEDFSASSTKNVKSSILGVKKMDGEDCNVVESKLHNAETTYSKVVTWISEKRSLPLKAEYFDKKGKLLKVISFEKYKLFGGKVWRAQKVSVKNVQTKRGTNLLLSNLKINSDLSEDEFTLSSLKED